MPQFVLTPDEVLHQCLVSYGSGTRGVSTRRDALDELIRFFIARFVTALRNDPARFTDQDASHTLEKIFVLRSAEAIGRLAALEATKRGALSIAVQDIRAARTAVINSNSPNPGDWCN